VRALPPASGSPTSDAARRRDRAADPRTLSTAATACKAWARRRACARGAKTEYVAAERAFLAAGTGFFTPSPAAGALPAVFRAAWRPESGQPQPLRLDPAV
jgi:hypothetical protein